MGKYRVEKMFIEQSIACCDTCDIRIVGKPSINPEDMKMVKDHIESIGNEFRINVTFPSDDEVTKALSVAQNSIYGFPMATAQVARRNGKTNYFKDWLFNQYSWTRPTKVIFHDPATIVFWNDGTKTVVKCQPGDTYSKEMGLALCFSKKMLCNQSNFNNEFKKWIPEE